MPFAIGRARRRRHRQRRVPGGRRPVRRYQLRRVLKRFARRIPRPQRKYLDNNWGAPIGWTSGSYVSGPYTLAESTSAFSAGPSTIPLGITQISMIGYKGQWKSLVLRLSHMISQSVLTAGSFMRVIVFFWKPPEALFTTGTLNTPSYNQILQDGNQAFTANGHLGTYLSPYNREWARSYKILFDKTYALTLTGSTGLILDKTYKKLRQTFMSHDPQNTAGLYTWVPYILFISNSAVDTEQPITNVYTRMTYVNF